MKLGLLSLLSTLIFVNIHYIRGNGIRIPLSIYDEGLHKTTDEYEDDQGLYGTISIGTPPQKINVIFSSTRYFSYVITVLSSVCKSSVCSDQNHNTYNHKNSTTFRGEDDFDTEIRRDNNYAKATDTITIGNFQIQNVSLEVTTSGDNFDNKPWDGIVTLDSGREFLKICEKLGLQKKFSFYTNSPWNNNTSELMLCGEDKTKFRGNMQYITIPTGYGGWIIPIQSIMLHHNHENVPIMEIRDEEHAIQFNFASSYIIGPEDYVKKIYDKLNIRTSKIRDDLKEVDCNNIHALPSITLVAADYNFTLTGNDYIKQMMQNDERVCIVRLLSHGYSRLWSMGSVFLRKVYTVFDDETPRRIGFAESAHPPAQIMVFLF